MNCETSWTAVWQLAVANKSPVCQLVMAKLDTGQQHVTDRHTGTQLRQSKYVNMCRILAVGGLLHETLTLIEAGLFMYRPSLRVKSSSAL